MVSNESISLRFWNKKFKLPYVLCIVALGVLSLGYVKYSLIKSSYAEKPTSAQQDECPPPSVVRYRLNGYNFTHPLLLADWLEESKELMGLKNEVALMINRWKQSGQITSASVYFRIPNESKWFSINPDEGFNPGSLIKVPIMITYLSEAEKNPGLLDKKLYLEASQQVPHQTYEGDRIVPGKSYTIKELLFYMIAKSDNYATLLLNQNVNIPAFKKLFTDLGLPEPDVRSRNFSITAGEYSKFLRVLYNASYVDPDDADFALSLMAQCDFKDGLLKNLPPEVKVAHKFGEWGDHNDASNHQLHESGIIYAGDNPYLITIMTKGTDVKMLPGVISEISKHVFDKMTVVQPKS